MLLNTVNVLKEKNIKLFFTQYSQHLEYCDGKLCKEFCERPDELNRGRRIQDQYEMITGIRPLYINEKFCQKSPFAGNFDEDGFHLNSEGNKIVAEIIYNAISSRL